MKKIPLRRCLGCFESKPKQELCRIVKTKEGDISIDKTGKIAGRGAYICNNKACLDKAIKTKRLEREFGQSASHNLSVRITDATAKKISNEIYEILRREISSGE